MNRSLSVADAPAFLALMKRYVVDYTNRHDQAVTRALMEPDYELRMGPHRVVGRDSAYFAATRKQMDQFPGLGLTVHEIWTSGQRLMMRFSEHGRSRRHGDAACAWGGIGLYVWNGDRLVRNFVEQDYLSRAQQLASGQPHPVEGPAISPWDTPPAEARPDAEAVVQAWLATGTLAQTPGVVCDDAWTGQASAQILDQSDLIENDLFSCGDRVGFHVTQRGSLREDFAAEPGDVGRPAELHMAGIVTVVDGRVRQGRIIRNRLELQRALRSGE